jgi:Zn finger protein HypA/HybF involved in hydrogenase expression
LIDVFGKWKEEHMTDMGIGTAHMNKEQEEKLHKTIKKLLNEGTITTRCHNCKHENSFKIPKNCNGWKAKCPKCGSTSKDWLRNWDE